VINKNFLEEPNILQLIIFNNVIRDESKVENNENLLSSKIKEAETINFILADGLGYKNLMSLDRLLFVNKCCTYYFAMMSHPM
jgi:hypothetical protein